MPWKRNKKPQKIGEEGFIHQLNCKETSVSNRAEDMGTPGLPHVTEDLPTLLYTYIPPTKISDFKPLEVGDNSLLVFHILTWFGRHTQFVSKSAL